MPRSYLPAIACLALAGCSHAAAGPESVAAKYVTAVDQPTSTSASNAARLAFLQPDDSIARFSRDSADPTPAADDHPWELAPVLTARSGIDSARRLPVPTGDTATIIVWSHRPSHDSLYGAIVTAHRAGLLGSGGLFDRGTLDVVTNARLSALVGDAGGRAPLETVADTVWLVRNAQRGWRVWTGDAIREHLWNLETVAIQGYDSLDSFRATPLPERVRVAEEMKRIMAATPRAFLEPYRLPRGEELETPARALRASQGQRVVVFVREDGRVSVLLAELPLGGKVALAGYFHDQAGTSLGYGRVEYQTGFVASIFPDSVRPEDHPDRAVPGRGSLELTDYKDETDTALVRALRWP